MKTISIIFCVLVALIIGCKDNSVSPVPNKFSTTLRGNVTLQNQTEHSNALVYIDSLNRGVSTDSSGNYIFTFTENDSVYTGEFNVYYFLNDYDMDSAKIMLVKGKIKLDTLDVGIDGKIQTKELEQMFSVTGSTDKSVYKIGDSIRYTAKYTNLTNHTLNFFSGGDTGALSWVCLYNENYAGIILNFHDPFGADFSKYLNSNEYYEASVTYKIPAKINDTDFPVLPGQYLLVSGINIHNRYSGVSQNLQKFIIDEWWKIYRDKSPILDLFPNKYNLPIVRIDD